MTLQHVNLSLNEKSNNGLLFPFNVCNEVTCDLLFVSEEAADVKDSAEKVKRALEEAQRAQSAANSAIRQAAADIQNTNNLLSSVSPRSLRHVMRDE